MLNVFYATPGETWQNFPWSFATYNEIVGGEALDSGAALDVAVETGAAGLTLSGEAISGTSVTFDMVVSSSAAVGDRILLAQVGTDGDPGTILTDRCTIRVVNVHCKDVVYWTAGADRLCAVDFSGHPCMLAGQILSGVPTITWDDATDITVSEEAIDTAADLAIFRIAVAAGRTTGRRVGKCNVSTTAGSVLVSYFDLTLR